MNLDEAKGKKWVITPQTTFLKSKLASIPESEQEAIIIVHRRPEADKAVLIDCSNQKIITRLSKSSLFQVTELLYSDNKSSQWFVLNVQGFFSQASSLTYRTKEKRLDMAHKERLSKIMKERRAKK